MHRGQVTGLTQDAAGWTLPPWKQDALLSALAVFGGDDSDARRTAALMIRGDPDEYEESIERLLVYLARYLRQDIGYLEQQPLDRLRFWFDTVKELVIAELGGRREGDGMANETDHV